MYIRLGSFADATAARTDAARFSPALPAGSHLTLVTTLADLDGLEPGWRRLEAQGLGAHGVFQTFEWARCWTQTYAESGDEPCIIAGFHGSELAFVWPLMRVRLGPLCILRWLSEPLAQYGDVLIGGGHCPRAWAAAAVGLVRQLRHIDSIRLRHVRADAVISPFLADTFRDARHPGKAPWLDLTRFVDEAAYDARYTGQQRKRRKKIRKALEADIGPVAFETLEPGPEAHRAIAQAISEKCKWIDQRGRQNHLSGSGRLIGFLQELSRSGSGPVKLIVSRMSAGGRPLSWEIGLRFGATHFSFITSHVSALTDYSPARLHMDASQRRALADGMQAFDLMVPHDAHKESWSSGAVGTHDYHLPLSFRGALYGRAYLELARPLLRDAYYRMPPKLLRLIKLLTGH
ncbi:MAG: GNAT family N-acetyltransferase [Rhizobiales bacterium]|nr:GNAT family N-acetyltransferase [Hyphomicrobiales bacterium]MBI3672204.1 GNAT family N-acetyltransferase [Hyphomicrobiales bacterium]